MFRTEDWYVGIVIVLKDSVPADNLIKVDNRKSIETFYEKTQPLPQATPQVVLRSACQAQFQRTERLVAEPVTNEHRVDSRFQGVPLGDPQQGGGERRGRFLAGIVQAIISHPDKKMIDCRIGGKQLQTKNSIQRAVEVDDS